MDVTAISPKYSGRLRAPAVIEGHGEDELAALTDLAIKLLELRSVEKRTALEEKKRAAYVQGAEKHSRTTLDRPLTQDELERVIDRYGKAEP